MNDDNKTEKAKVICGKTNTVDEEFRFVLVDDDGRIQVGADTPLDVNLAEYDPVDLDTGGGTSNALPVTLRNSPNGDEAGVAGNPLYTTPDATPAGTGWTTKRIAAQTDTPTVVSATPATLAGAIASNPNADEDNLLQVFNTATPVVGTTPPVFEALIPAGSSAPAKSGAMEIMIPPPGVAFGTAMSVAVTQSDGSTAPSSGCRVLLIGNW